MVPKAGRCHPSRMGAQRRKAASGGDGRGLRGVRTQLPERGDRRTRGQRRAGWDSAGRSETRSSPARKRRALQPLEGPSPSPLLIWQEGLAEAPALLPSSRPSPRQPQPQSPQAPFEPSLPLPVPSRGDSHGISPSPPRRRAPSPLLLSWGQQSEPRIVHTHFPSFTLVPCRCPMPVFPRVSHHSFLWLPLLISFLCIFCPVTMVFDRPTISPFPGLSRCF